MSLPATKILANVQSDIDDLGMDKIQEGEYLDFFNDILSDVATKTELWIVRYSATPIIPTTVLTNPLYQIFVPYQDTNGIIAPDHILRIVRQNGTTITETREYSIHALMSTLGGNDSFPINDYQLGELSFATQRDGTDGFIVTFATSLQMNETIIIDFVTGNPMTMNTWTPGNASATFGSAMIQQATAQGATLSVTLPDMLCSSVYLGVLFRALQRMFLKGDDGASARMQYVKAEYDKELLYATRKAKMLKDNNSRLQIQPINWLAE